VPNDAAEENWDQDVEWVDFHTLTLTDDDQYTSIQLNGIKGGVWTSKYSNSKVKIIKNITKHQSSVKITAVSPSK
jgi:hypothetical protein